jgi:membrane complex biogenesis BtpA family protein
MKMSRKCNDVFKKEKNVVIGAIHFPPLLGYSEFPGIEIALKNALSDLTVFQDNAFDAVIIENNYDSPHQEFVSPSVIASLTYLACKIKEESTIPVGISVLWNDYKTALSIAKIVGLDFIRIPVFVDTVKTSYGIVEGNAKDVIAYRSSIGAEDVLLCTDIHVKHSEILSSYTILESALRAVESGSDALILTGKWTGDMPNMEEMQSVRDTIGDFPILCGSGVNEENVKELFTIANGAIVSTSLKEGLVDSNEVNIKPYSQRISQDKVILFRKAIC